MQKQNDLAINLMNLFNPNEYVQFEEGYFVNQPKLKGWFYIFRNITKPRFCVIINASDIVYKTPMVKIGEFVYIVFNIKSIEEFTENLGTEYMDEVLTIIDQNLNKENTRNLPYGYYYDENGNLKINLRKAQEVRKIYNRYIETESIRQIADEQNVDFSHIRDILHDNEEYMQMQQKILPMTMLKQINELMAKNVKGRFRENTTAEKIKELQKKNKQARKQQEEMLAQQQQAAQQQAQ